MWKNQKLISEHKYRIVFVGNAEYKTLLQVNWNRQAFARQLFILHFMCKRQLEV